MFGLVFLTTNIINCMKQSRVSIQNKLPPRPQLPKSNISSLKAIMNQGRVPLAQYINHRKHVPTHQHLSYFDKLKAMFHHKDCDSTAQLDQPVVQQQQAMDIEEPSARSGNFLNNFTETGVVTPLYAAMQKARGDGSVGKHKERSKSVNANSKIKQPVLKQLPRPTLNHKPNHSQFVVPENNKFTATVNDSGEKIAATDLFVGRGKQMKKQTVNYKKFNVIFEGYWQGGVVELSEVLGCGATANVRIGRDRKTSQEFAVKVYEKYKLVDSIRKKRVLQEIDILGKLKHPNIIGLAHCCQDKRQIHLLLELVPNAETLQEFVRRHSYDVPMAAKIQIATKVVEAVCYLHQMGVAHRDIKTENVILGSDGLVKLIDFGFATTIARGETHCGTPNYMAPELFQKKGFYQPMKVDVWALGVLLYYLYQGYSQKQLARSIWSGNYSFKKTQGWIKVAIQATLKVQPNERSDAEQLLAMIKSAK